MATKPKYKALRFRIYPDQEQRILINKTFGCCRFVYNYLLDKRDKFHESTGKSLSHSACITMLPSMKKQEETVWLKEVDSIALQASIEDLRDGYDRFFKGQNQHPLFKSKRTEQSYTTKLVNDNIEIIGNHIKLPKLGLIRFAKSRDVKGRILRVTICRSSAQKYFISILTEVEIKPKAETGSAVGIDLGLKDFAIISNGDKITNPRHLKKYQDQLARDGRKLSHRARIAKGKGIALYDAKNYQKQKLKVAKVHERIANLRTDFLQKFSTEIVKNHDIICVEDLSVKEMMQDPCMAKAISDVSWSRFLSMLEYKADWYGKQLVVIDRYFPSSQICSSCGHNDGKKDLSIRHWTCSVCGTYHDRDLNASMNILAEGLTVNLSTAGDAGVA